MIALTKVAKPLLPLLILFAIVAFGYFLNAFAHHWLSVRMEDIHHLGLVGVLIFFVIMVAVGVFGFLPSSILGVFGGIMYGAVNGFIICALAIMSAAMISYWLASFEHVSSTLKARVKFISTLDSALSKNGWFIVSLIRLSPVMPFSLASFGLGLTSVRFRDYMIGTLSSLPSLFLYVDTGDIGDSSFNILKFTLLAFGFVSTIVIGVWTGKALSSRQVPT